MQRFIIFIFLCASFLYSRENPFAPVEDLNISKATNIEDRRKEFSSKTTKLPSDARILKYITYGYQSLDGSIQSQKVVIDEKVDWHDPLVLTRESHIVSLNESRKDLVPSPPVSLTSNVEDNSEEDMKTVVKFKDLLSFEMDKKTLFIRTDDKNIRHFMVVKPYKIVLDFERDTSFYTRKIKLEQTPFELAQMGNHNGYYRAAIWLDGPYKYSVEQNEDGVLITLK